MPVRKGGGVHHAQRASRMQRTTSYRYIGSTAGIDDADCGDSVKVEKLLESFSQRCCDYDWRVRFHDGLGTCRSQGSGIR